MCESAMQKGVWGGSEALRSSRSLMVETRAKMELPLNERKPHHCLHEAETIDADCPRVSRLKTAVARQLRRMATRQEAVVWEWVRNRKMLGLKWRRQEVIAGVVAGLHCAEHKLVLEIDGSVHDSPEAAAYDRQDLRLNPSP